MVGIGDADERLVVASDEHHSRAGILVYRFPAGPDNSQLHPARLFGATPAESPEARHWEPVTVVGSPYGCVKAPTGADDTYSWLAAAYHAGDAKTSSGGTAFIPFLTDDTAASIDHHLPEATLLLSSVRVTLPISTRSIDEYYSTLSKRLREQVRRERRLLARGNREITVEPLTPELVPTLAQLQENTQQHHKAFGDAAYFERRFMRMAQSELADSTVVMICRNQGRAIGFMMAIIHENTLVEQTIGLDYKNTGSYAEYFNLLVHEPVQFCVDNNLREIDLGFAGLHQKLIRGGQPELVWSAMIATHHTWTPSQAKRHNKNFAALLRMRLAPTTSHLTERLKEIETTGLHAPVASCRVGSDGS